ncbi:MAG: hypothetical protein FP815_02670 [Desulfobulbaceae bacterium]|nr:hypothetical protein [Desulfobulbaceae bacterium]
MTDKIGQAMGVYGHAELCKITGNGTASGLGPHQNCSVTVDTLRWEGLVRSRIGQKAVNMQPGFASENGLTDQGMIGRDRPSRGLGNQPAQQRQTIQAIVFFLLNQRQ